MEEVQHKQEECDRYLTKIRIGNKAEKQKDLLTKETMQLELYMTTVQRFLILKEKLLKKNLNQNHQ